MKGNGAVHSSVRLLATPTTTLPRARTFQEDLNDFIHVEAELVHVLAYVLVQCPASRAVRPWLRFGSAYTGHRSLSYAALPLHAGGGW